MNWPTIQSMTPLGIEPLSSINSLKISVMLLTTFLAMSDLPCQLRVLDPADISSLPDDLDESLKEASHHVIATRHVARENDRLDIGERVEEVAIFIVIWYLGHSL